MLRCWNIYRSEYKISQTHLDGGLVFLHVNGCVRGPSFTVLLISRRLLEIWHCTKQSEKKGRFTAWSWSVVRKTFSTPTYATVVPSCIGGCLQYVWVQSIMIEITLKSTTFICSLLSNLQFSDNFVYDANALLIDQWGWYGCLLISKLRLSFSATVKEHTIPLHFLKQKTKVSGYSEQEPEVGEMS